MDTVAWDYIMTNKPKGTVYVGCTVDLVKRVWEHKSKPVKSFTQRYNLDKLVWYEQHGSLDAARKKERQMKRWRKDWKFRLVEEMNSDWQDLFEQIAR